MNNTNNAGNEFQKKFATMVESTLGYRKTNEVKNEAYK
jgi:hypothetical protein